MKQKRGFVSLENICFYLGLFSILLAIKGSYGLFTDTDIQSFQCQEGWVGELPQNYNESMEECDNDKSQAVECQKHCLARKMGLFLDGKILLYKLIDVLGNLYPGEAGKDSVDKMTDVILECSDEHYKTFGPLALFHCSREKKMWLCILKAAEAICATNNERDQEIIKDRRSHVDAVVIVHDGPPDKSGRGKEVILLDY